MTSVLSFYSTVGNDYITVSDGEIIQNVYIEKLHLPVPLVTLMEVGKMYQLSPVILHQIN